MNMKIWIGQNCLSVTFRQTITYVATIATASGVKLKFALTNI